MIGIGGTLFSQEKIWDTEFAVRVSRDSYGAKMSYKKDTGWTKIRLFFTDII